MKPIYQVAISGRSWQHVGLAVYMTIDAVGLVGAAIAVPALVCPASVVRGPLGIAADCGYALGAAAVASWAAYYEFSHAYDQWRDMWRTRRR